MTVKIITDSCCDIPVELAKNLISQLRKNLSHDYKELVEPLIKGMESYIEGVLTYKILNGI